MRRRIATAVALISIAVATGLAQADKPRDRAMTAYRYGLEHMRAEAFEDAEKAFAGAVEIDPTFELAYYMLGRAQMPQKKFGRAVDSFARARQLYVEAAGRRFSSVQEAQRYRRDRMMELDEIIRQVQNGPQNQQTQMQLRQLNDRKRVLQEDIQRGGDVSISSSVPAYVSLSLGSAYFRSGNLSEAERYYKEAVAADDRAGEALNNLAVVYMETGRLNEAETALKQAEKAGFKVAPALKEEIRKRKSGTF